MFVTAKMTQLTGSALLEDIDQITKVFLKNGILEPLMIDNLDGTQEYALDISGNSNIHDRIVELQQRVEALLMSAKIPVPLVDSAQVDTMEPVHLDQCQKLLTQIDNSIRELREKQQKYEEELRRKRELLHSMKVDSQVVEFGTALDDLRKDTQANDLLQVRAGKISASFFTNFSEKITRQINTWVEHTPAGNDMLIRLVYFKTDEAPVGTILQQSGWTEIPLEDVFISSKETSIAHLSDEIAQTEKAQEAVQREVIAKISSYKDDLLSNWTKLHMNELYSLLQKSFSQTTYTCFFAGWVPAHLVEKLKKELTEATKGRILLEVNEAKEVRDREGKKIEPPTDMENPPLLKPFETLVKTYGVPAYNTIDSTPLVGVLFITMFGFMFADAGHGAVIFLAGLLSFFFTKKKNKDFNFLIVYCGLASIICGVIFGSYFGFQLTKPLWFDYESIATNRISEYGLKTSIVSINDVFKISIFFGIGVIYLSYLLNWINRLRRGELIELFLERNGILGGWMYAVGIRLVWNYTASNYSSFGNTSHLWLTLGLPMMCLFLAEPAKYFFHEEKEHRKAFSLGMLGGWFGNWVIEVFEFIVNSLSNTISFIRVAGLGMAHIILMSTFYGMAKNFGPIGSMTIIILANVIVIALEGLSAAINSIRLNYYEFFTRFFIGNGRLYEPVRLNRN